MKKNLVYRGKLESLGEFLEVVQSFCVLVKGIGNFGLVHCALKCPAANKTCGDGKKQPAAQSVSQSTCRACRHNVLATPCAIHFKIVPRCFADEVAFSMPLSITKPPIVSLAASLVAKFFWFTADFGGFLFQQKSVFINFGFYFLCQYFLCIF